MPTGEAETDRSTYVAGSIRSVRSPYKENVLGSKSDQDLDQKGRETADEPLSTTDDGLAELNHQKTRVQQIKP